MFVSNEWDRLFQGNNIKVTPEYDSTTAEFVEAKHREKDHYGDYIQDEGEIHVIFKVGDRYFKKTGYQSSYGDDRDWDGYVTEVFPQTKTFTVFTNRREND